MPGTEAGKAQCVSGKIFFGPSALVVQSQLEPRVALRLSGFFVQENKEPLPDRAGLVLGKQPCLGLVIYLSLGLSVVRRGSPPRAQEWALTPRNE